MLAVFGYCGDLKGVAAWSSRIVHFHRHELRHFIFEKLREAKADAVSSRSLAETILSLKGKDSRDRQIANDMVKRVGKPEALAGAGRGGELEGERRAGVAAPARIIRFNFVPPT